jgi:hypothetical protein
MAERPIDGPNWQRVAARALVEKIAMHAELDRLRSALQTIRGPEDRGPWIEVYRAAGGGYEGLQAIARAALREDGDDD